MLLSLAILLFSVENVRVTHWPVHPGSSLFMGFLVVDDAHRPYTMQASAGVIRQPSPDKAWEWTYKPAAKALEIVVIDLVRTDGDNERFELLLEPHVENNAPVIKVVP